MQDHVENLIKSMKDENFEMVDLKFVDLFGQWHHLTVPTKNISTGLRPDFGTSFNCSIYASKITSGSFRKQ